MGRYLYQVAIIDGIIDRGKAVTHKEARKMKRLSGGIDIGSESHHITILDEEDNVLYNQKVFHKLSEFTSLKAIINSIGNARENSIVISIK